ncbi:hypothetical protein HaLaN_10023 [Haematococcus lacustris]|uniref:Uncharacterized protein n=1 Tax=Haematococcus lacustris TaxID=44745 RepID=A0A699Z3V8_HAELA|nr:hypothetical protein HaLaN_10023 [Haematococcus lacustris]
MAGLGVHGLISASLRCSCCPPRHGSWGADKCNNDILDGVARGLGRVVRHRMAHHHTAVYPAATLAALGRRLARCAAES